MLRKIVRWIFKDMITSVDPRSSKTVGYKNK